MRRGLLLMVSLTSVAALAGWHAFSAPAFTGPRDLVAPDGGVFVFTGTNGVVAWQVWPDGGASPVAQPMVGNYVGAGLFNGTCLVAVNGAVGNPSVDYSSAACGTNQPVPSATTTARRCALIPSGRLALTSSATSTETLWYASVPSGAPASVLTAFVPPSVQHGLSFESFSGIEIAVFPTGQASLAESVDGGTVFAVPTGFVSQDVALVTLNGEGAVASVTTGSALRFATGIFDAGMTPLTPAVAPSGCQFVTFTEAGGDARGRGFGMVTTVDGGVHSPIPDPSLPGMVWVQRPPPGTPALTGRVKCLDASFCVATGPGPSEVSAYFNGLAPTVQAPAGVVLVPGLPQAMSVVAVDPDGDPVFVSWSATGAQVTTDGGDGTSFEVTATGASCANPTVALTYTVSDGLASHVRTGTFPVAVQGLLGPAQPVISPASAEIWPGSGPVQFTASDDGGCPVTLTWTIDGQRSTGPTATYVPPATNCSADAGVVLVSVVAEDAVDASVPATATVTVRPWGLPDAPVFDGGSQVAGTTRLWSPADPGNVCSAVPGFPGAALRWVRIGPLPPGTTAEGQDGGLLVVSTDGCTQGVLQAQAVRHLVGSTVESDAGSLVVSLVPYLSPLADAGFSMGFTYDQATSRIGGVFSTGATCPGLRGLGAEVEVWRDGGALVTSQAFAPVPGPWGLVVPGSCNGGDFVAIARLLEDGGATGLEDRQAFATPVLAVALGDLTPSSLPVTCGAGAHGTLSLPPRPGSCQAVEWTWRQTGGPALDGGTLTGGSLEVQTADTGFELLGQELVFEVSADAGAGNGAQEEVRVSFTVEPFLQVASRLTPRPVREEESAVVQVAVSNPPESCDVHGVELQVALTGLRPIAESAQLDGQHVEATAGNPGLRVLNVDVAAGQTRTLRFRAQPKVMSRVEVSAKAYVAGLQVSVEPPPAQPSGCGCGAGAGGPLSVALLALLGWARRRRKW